MKALTDSLEAFRRIDKFLGETEVPPAGANEHVEVPDGESTSMQHA